MKTFFLLISISLFILTGCDQTLVDELKTRNNELRIENASLKAQVVSVKTNLKKCQSQKKEAFYKYDPSKIDLTDDENISVLK